MQLIPTIKHWLKLLLPPILWRVMKSILQKYRKFTSPTKNIRYSFLEEESVINKYLTQLGIKDGFCVDIAASDGITMSNTFFLYLRGWKGIAVELNANRFSALAENYRNLDVQLFKTKVTPKNVVPLLRAGYCPKKFQLLNFDIDSYDYFVLNQLLQEFRPALICMEINEKLPPPIEFTVTFDDAHYWHEDHFYGQSIMQAYKLCRKFSYDIVELHYNNLFIIPREINVAPALTPQEAYRRGYQNMPDRKQKFKYNSDMEILQTLDRQAATEFIKTKFSSYRGKYFLK